MSAEEHEPAKSGDPADAADTSADAIALPGAAAEAPTDSAVGDGGSSPEAAVSADTEVRSPDPDSASESAAPVTTAPGARATAAERLAPWRRFVFLAVPAVALLEFAAHVVQISHGVPASDWLAARAAVKAKAAKEDLVVFAPRWVDPVGREYFKDELATVEREARPDDTRFPRAFEVSIRGASLPELSDWKELSRERFGAVVVTTLANPAPSVVLDDLTLDLVPGKADVSLVDGDRTTPCAFTHGPIETGGLGFGAGIPADRFACPRGGFVAVSVMQATDYRPHKCIYAPAVGGPTILRVRFTDVAFGKVLHGHHAIYWDAARENTPPVVLVWKAQGKSLVRLVDMDTDGWKPFEIDTSEWAGQKGELVAEITSPAGSHRQYCFEADTR